MAKDNRLILSGIRVGNDVFTDGKEDELQALLSAEDGARLIEAGALTGDWEFGKAPDVQVASPDVQVASPDVQAKSKPRDTVQ